MQLFENKLTYFRETKSGLVVSGLVVRSDEQLQQTCMESKVFGTSSSFIHTALVSGIFLDVFTTCTFRSLGHLHTALVSRIFQDFFSCYKLQLYKIVTRKDMKPKQYK